MTRVQAWVGRHAGPVRVVGAVVLVVVSVASGIQLVDLSRALSNTAPADVESLMIVSFSDDRSASSLAQEGVGVAAARATTQVLEFDPSLQDDFALEMSAQLSGEAISAVAGTQPLIRPTMLVGGRLADSLTGCADGDSVARTDFSSLLPGEQEAVLADIEDQFIRLQTLREVPTAAVTSTAIRKIANDFAFARIVPGDATDATWNQDIPDDLRARPADSGEQPQPQQQQFTGSEWAIACRIDRTIVRQEAWGPRLEIPAIGLAIPGAWQPAAGGSEAANAEDSGDSTSVSIPVEIESTLSWMTSATDLDRQNIAETTTTTTLRSETEQAERVQATGVFDPDTDIFLDQGLVETDGSVVVSDVAYLSAGRYSLRFSTVAYRTFRDIGLFAAGALFSLAATLSIGVAKTGMRRYLRHPKP